MDLEGTIISRKEQAFEAYNLGLGENKPVEIPGVASKEWPQTLPPNVHMYRSSEAVHCQYLVEHEAVSKFPSPHDNKDLKAELLQRSLPKPKPRRVVPLRLAEDVVQIRPTKRSLPEKYPFNSNVAQARIDSRHFDPNTPWVEMLIHEQLVVYTD